ncbi:hypothetical protein [Amycolatopsis magusensis]|uniref:Cell division septum initiation protein DivIVA n=1 Tax=Amycolatopsis magusensis TaxID=882444 RepID=A0ABS4PWN3_9PSEU|nr:hypothetical protein [Amycolatopsis magusensis]MBP2183839.1 cell division septum initiation protein DivIVA [Amycolatopsis magusensis]
MTALAAALAACPAPLRTALTQLTPADLSKALSATPVARRPRVLLPLGLRLTPRHIGQPLCRDVLSRLSRARDHDAHHAAAALTRVVFTDVIAAAADREASPAPRDPAECWSPALARVCVWAHGLASIADARIWRWAAEQSWFRPDGVSPTHTAAITTAADRVIAATADYRFPARATPYDPGPTPSPPQVASTTAASRFPTSHDREDEDEDTVTTTDTPSPAITGDTEIATETQPGAAQPGAVTDIVQLSQDLQHAIAEAIPAAQRVLDGLRADRAPTLGDLEVLAAARARFDTAVATLHASGDTVDPASTVATITAALSDLITATSDEAAVRARLAQLRTFTAPETNAALAEALTAAQTQAAQFAATPQWSEDDRRHASTLTTLITLADPATTPEQAMALQQDFVHAYPALALLAITASQLTHTHPGAAPAPPLDEAPSPAPAQTAATPKSTPDPDQPAQPEDSPRAQDHTPPPGASSASNAPKQAPEDHTAPRADVTAHPEPDHVAAQDRVIADLAGLIATQRFGMATALARAAQQPASRQSILRIAALATAVRSDAGAVTSALRGELIDLDTDEVAEDSLSTLLAVVSLLRAALVTGEPTTGAVLAELATRVEPTLSGIADQVGRRALRGVLVDTPPLTVLADVTEIEQSLHTIRDAAHAMLRPRTLRFKRATDIAKAWMAPGGLLGTALTAAATDNRTALHEVTSLVRRLADNAEVAREIDASDRKYRGKGGKPIEGAARQDLTDLVAEAVQHLAEWTNAVLIEQRAGSAQQWATGEISDMRAAVLSNRDAAIAALTAQAHHADPLLAAASQAAADSLNATMDVLAGTATLPTREPTPAFAITAELLKVPGATVDTAVNKIKVAGDISVDELLAAASRTWTEAIEQQITAENFDTAEFVAHAAHAGLLPGMTDADDADSAREATVTIATARSTVRAELATLNQELTVELRRARSNNEVSEEQGGELSGYLRDADPDSTGNLALVRRQLQRVADLLPRYRADAAERLSRRLAALGNADPATSARVTRLIASGDLATAEELLYFHEIGEVVPPVTQSVDLQRFFPAVPQAIANGLTPALIGAVQGRKQVPGCEALDYTQLNTDFAELAATALTSWRKLATTPAEARRQISERDLLLPALSLVGIEGKRIRQLDELPRDRDRRFLDVLDVTISGKALVPAFGSKLGGRLRILLAWGHPTAPLLLSRADHDNSGDSLLIAYFGTMSPHTRRELARHAVTGHHTAPVVVLDDAALAYLAAHGNRQMEATMNILLPFSNINPYVSKKRGLVAEEMFYGRDAERKGVLDPDGTQLLYGGRGLGKSALLRSAGQLFESQGERGERVSLYLSLDTTGIRAGAPIGSSAIWDTLQRELIHRGLIPAAPRRGSSQRKPHEHVRTGLLDWIETDPRRRLLVLLDETDRFFESDAPEFFETNRLKELGTTTDGRIKVVFAGLHSVQRYAKSARNGPFSHLAQRPTVIGPLPPRWAANLLTRPLHALGYRFADDDLVHRILGYCSYQPFLLQMFGWRLIATMQTHRAGEVADTQPPYVITHADVVSVESNPDLKADISAAFHDTLHLDPRYNVIANVLAHHAHEFGLDARLSDVELREECLSWWDDGFVTLDVEGFRAYLREMVGLGVLAPNNDGRGWHLRSPNVLNMIGSKDDVATELIGAATDSVLDEVIAMETRPALRDGRRSPLTAGQLDDVLGDHANQVRVVLGSRATGIYDADQAIRTGADVGSMFTVPCISNRKQFEDELVSGEPGQRRVVVTDFASRIARDEAATVALTAALERLPDTSGVTRSAVIIAGPEHMTLWREVLTTADHTPALGTVTLRRYDRHTLHLWALASEKFTGKERLERLHQVTGGWPLYVERAAELVAAGHDESHALARISDHLASDEGAAELINAIGITADDDLAAAFSSVLTLVDNDQATLADLIDAAEETVDQPHIAVACMESLAIFNLSDDGKYSIEPLLVRSWPRRG